jgi:hypothetical protein
MYTSIRIQNFRGIEDLEIKDLGRINLLVGANNVGKTSVLEALALLRMHQTGYELQRILENRGYNAAPAEDARRDSLQGALESLFRSPNGDFVVEARNEVLEPGEEHELLGPQVERLIGRTNLALDGHPLGLRHHFGVFLSENAGIQLYYDLLEAESRRVHDLGALVQVRLNLVPGAATPYPEPFSANDAGPVYFSPSLVRLSPTAMARLVSSAEGTARFGALSGALNLFDDRFERLSVGFDPLSQAPSLRVVVKGQGGVLPATALGDGVRRLLEFVVVTSGVSSAVVLIDEVDSGIYYKHLPRAWELFRDVTGYARSQLFATTHSWECVAAAVEVARGYPQEFRLHRLQRRGDRVDVVTYDHEVALAATTGLVEVR